MAADESALAPTTNPRGRVAPNPYVPLVAASGSKQAPHPVGTSPARQGRGSVQDTDRSHVFDIESNLPLRNYSWRATPCRTCRRQERMPQDCHEPHDRGGQRCPGAPRKLRRRSRTDTVTTHSQKRCQRFLKTDPLWVRTQGPVGVSLQGAATGSPYQSTKSGDADPR
jgi:hypothetical protein